MSKKIFISHSAKDKGIADAFVDLILQGALSVPISEIFCVSTDGTKIKSGDDWRDSIKKNILSAKINFLLISPNYKESEVCLNEMGAAWMTDSKVLPLIIEPINYKTVGVIQEPKQIEKLLDEASLDRVKDIVQDELNIESSQIKSDRWTAKKREFLIKVRKHLDSNPFETPMDRKSFQQLINDKNDLEKTVENLIDEKTECEAMVNELKKVKDKTAVAAIFKKHKKTTQYEKFKELCKVVKSLLNKQSPIVNGIIFKSYSGKGVEIRSENFRDELDEALANDFITDDLDIDWNTTKEMKEISESLKKVSNFINSDSELESDFFNTFNEEYTSPFDIKNKKFWEEVFEANLRFK